MPATARFLNVPFKGCASHRLHLAVTKYIEDNFAFNTLVEKISNNMNIVNACKNIELVAM
jgi:hypothetical protein